MIAQTLEKRIAGQKRWNERQHASAVRYANKVKGRPRKTISVHGHSDFSKAMFEADTWFRRYIRMRDGKCVTWSMECSGQLEASHLFPVSGGVAMRFDERAVNAQCHFHNQLHKTNTWPYTRWFINRNGDEVYDQLSSEHRSNPLQKVLTVIKLKRIVEIYKVAVKKLASKR